MMVGGGLAPLHSRVVIGSLLNRTHAGREEGLRLVANLCCEHPLLVESRCVRADVIPLRLLWFATCHVCAAAVAGQGGGRRTCCLWWSHEQTYIKLLLVS